MTNKIKLSSVIGALALIAAPFVHSALQETPNADEKFWSIKNIVVNADKEGKHNIKIPYTAQALKGAEGEDKNSMFNFHLLSGIEDTTLRQLCPQGYIANIGFNKAKKADYASRIFCYTDNNAEPLWFDVRQLDHQRLKMQIILTSYGFELPEGDDQISQLMEAKKDTDRLVAIEKPTTPTRNALEAEMSKSEFVDNLNHSLETMTASLQLTIEREKKLKETQKKNLESWGM